MEPDSVQHRDGSGSREKVSLPRAVVVSLLGSIAEWYDFSIFGAASALVFSKLFFPESSPVVGTLLALSTYASGFVVRPVGAALFGHFGDRIGRKPMLIITFTVMGAGTLLIGLLPTYSTIGPWAPILLVCIRMVQGIAMGGEFGGAAVLVAEYSPPRHRGFYGSFSMIGLSAGILIASAVFGAFAGMPQQAFLAWGWRIPFLLSIVLIAIGLYVRITLAESPVFQNIRHEGGTESVPFVGVMRKEWRAVLLVFGSRAGETMQYNIFSTFIIGYASKEFGLSGSSLLFAASVGGVVSLVVMPAAAAWSDRIGRRQVFRMGGILCIALGAAMYPAFAAGTLWAMVMLIIASVGFVAGLSNATLGSWLPELFQTRQRYTGAGLGYQLGTVAGGISPVLVSLITNAFGGTGAVVYVLLGGVLTVVAVSFLPETVHKGKAITFGRSAEVGVPDVST